MTITSSGGAAGSWTMVTDPSLSFNFLTKPALNCPSFRKQSGVKWFAQPDINKFSESEVMCGQVWWPILGICALHLTHPSAHTHTHIAAAPGEQLGVRCLAQGSHLSRGIEGGKERWLFTPKSKWLDNWDRLGFWGIKKKGVNFHHCRVVVSTHC